MRYPVYGISTNISYDYTNFEQIAHLRKSGKPRTICGSLLYYPISDTGSVADELPLIVFLHGWQPTYTPWRYEYYIEHLVKSGFMVLFAKFQHFIPGPVYMANAAKLINRTIRHIENTESLPRLKRNADGQPLYGLVGYSLGAITALNLAADYKLGRSYPSGGFLKPAATMVPTPKPLFVYALELSNGSHHHFLETGSPTTNLGGHWSNIDDDTYVVMTSGDNYPLVDYQHIFPYWNALEHIPTKNKQFIGFNSDLKPGSDNPSRVDAMHIWPSSWPNVKNCPTLKNMNALHFALLRTTVAIAKTAFFDEDYEFWYDYESIGTWPDGTSVNSPFLWHGDALSNDVWPKRPGA